MSTATALSLAALSELAFAQLDLIRERKGIDKCERDTRARRKILNRVSEKVTAVTPDVLASIAARKEVLEALAERCEACGECVLSLGRE
jgi:hypothetical protein